MQIELPPEIEKVALHAVMDGRFRSIEDFVTAAVMDSPLVVGEDSQSEVRLPYSAQEWQQRFHDFLSQQVSTVPDFDDSRESMYPDR